MLDYLKSILGLSLDFTDFDLYLSIVCAVAILWTVKLVITGLYSAVLHIFYK